MVMKNQSMKDMKFLLRLAKFKGVRTAAEFTQMVLTFLELKSFENRIA